LCWQPLYLVISCFTFTSCTLAPFGSLCVSRMHLIRVFLHGTGRACDSLSEQCELLRCDPRKWGCTGGLTAIHQACVLGHTFEPGYMLLSGFPLSTDHFMLLEIQYILKFSLSSPHFTTQTWPTNTHDLWDMAVKGCCMKYHCSCQQTGTASLFLCRCI